MLTVNAEDGERANKKCIDDFVKMLMDDYLATD